jgi:alpha-beta hydrolase superfamily lysophospholipase
VLLAYGLLGELMQRFAPLGIDYMGAQLAWLRDGLGLPAEVVALPTAAPVAANAARLAATIAGDSRPVLLVGHSKGGLEGLAALLDPAAAARCRAFVALQSPFLGSPVADALVAARLLHQAAGLALGALKLGSGEGLLDLTTAARGAWMAAHAAQVADLLARLPVLTAATGIGADCAPADRRYLPLARWVAARAGPNDGLVPVASALLPGTIQVVLPGAHRALVARGRGRDPVGLLRPLLGRVLGTEASAAV